MQVRSKKYQNGYAVDGWLKGCVHSPKSIKKQFLQNEGLKKNWKVLLHIVETPQRILRHFFIPRRPRLGDRYTAVHSRSLDEWKNIAEDFSFMIHAFEENDPLNKPCPKSRFPVDTLRVKGICLSSMDQIRPNQMNKWNKKPRNVTLPLKMSRNPKRKLALVFRRELLTPPWMDLSPLARAMGNQTPVLHCRTPERLNGCDLAATRSDLGCAGLDDGEQICVHVWDPSPFTWFSAMKDSKRQVCHLFT